MHKMNFIWRSPSHVPFTGKYVTLRPSDFSRDSAALYSLSHGNADLESVWNFMFVGPFASAEDLKDYYTKTMTGGVNPLPWTVYDNASNEPVGIATLLNVVPEHGRAEVGHIWMTHRVQRTKINTETQYLFLKYLFEELKYRRVEWKCDSLNHRSRTAATRLGFVYEGRFRQHMVIKGQNRDTDWFAMIDKDWPRCRENFEKWLYGSDPVSLMELNWGVGGTTDQ